MFVGASRRTTLVGIAAAADAFNRDYLPDAVFRTAVDGLAARGLVSVNDAGIESTARGRSLLKETEHRRWLDQADEITRRLPEFPPEALRTGLVPEGAYAAAITEYVERFERGERTFL